MENIDIEKLSAQDMSVLDLAEMKEIKEKVLAGDLSYLGKKETENDDEIDL